MLSSLMERIRHLTRNPTIRQQGRFLTVGVICTVVDFGVFNTLAYGPFDVDRIAANTVSFVVSVTVSFILNRMWTFRRQGRIDWAREAIPFLVVSLAGLIMSNVAIWTAGRYLSTHILIINAAKVGGVATIWFLKFFIFKSFVFADRAPQEPEDLGLEEAEAGYPTVPPPRAAASR